MKKIISLLLTLTILVSVVAVSVPVSAALECKEGRYYIGDTYFDYEIVYDSNEAGGTLCVMRFSDNFSRKFTVPDEIDGVRYDEVVFEEINFLQTLVLGDGIKFFELYYSGHGNRFLSKENNIEYLYVGKSFEPGNFERMRNDYDHYFPNLKDVFISEDNPYVTTGSMKTHYNMVYTKDYKELLYIPTMQLKRSNYNYVEWDNRVRVIHDNVFTPIYGDAKRLELSKSQTVKLTLISSCAFENSGVVEFNFGKNIKTVFAGIFENSKRLKKVTFYQTGKNLKEIKYDAFRGCSKLSEVRMTRLTKAPTIGRKAFEGTKSGIKFYVKNRTVAKQLRTELLKKSKVKNAQILVGKKVIYKNITDK